MNSKRLSLPGFLVIGAYGRNAGKTTFSEQVLHSSERQLTAVKITIVKGEAKGCPRGGVGCGVCSSLDKPFEITEEKNSCGGKDTSRLLAAGAGKVLWLRVRDDSVVPGLNALLPMIGSNIPVICESNSIIPYIEPGLFLLLKSETGGPEKKSARAVEDRADLIITTRPEGALFDFSRLTFGPEGWILRPFPL